MILCPTGPLVAAALSNDDNHHSCVELFSGFNLACRELLVTATVVAEVGYLLGSRADVRTESLFLRALVAGDFISVEPTAGDYARMAELVTRYGDLPLGTTDASVAARGATRCHRDRNSGSPTFLSRPPRHAQAFRLLPE